MKVRILLFNFVLFCCITSAVAQIDAGSLMGIPTASTSERIAITGVQIGSLIYDTDINRVFQYTNTGWLEFLTTQNIYLGFLEITGPAPATINITGLPFRPTQVSFAAHANVDALTLNTDNAVGNNNGGIANSFGSMNGFARENPDASITQQVIYVGGSGNSINDISRHASSNCIGIRYSNQNGNQVGLITANLAAFTATGFNLNVTYAAGTPATERLVVLYTAYR